MSNKDVGRPKHDPIFFSCSSFLVKHGVKHAHSFLPSTLIQCRHPFAGKRGSKTYFVNLVSTSYRENEKSGEVK